MPTPDCIFVTPPVSLSFLSNVKKSVKVNINPMSENPFHVIFTLNFNPALFGNGGKSFEIFPVNPKDPYGNDDYDFEIVLKKIIAEPVYTQLHVRVVSSSGKSTEDPIAITIN